MKSANQELASLQESCEKESLRQDNFSQDINWLVLNKDTIRQLAKVFDGVTAELSSLL